MRPHSVNLGINSHFEVKDPDMKRGMAVFEDGGE